MGEGTPLMKRQKMNYIPSMICLTGITITQILTLAMRFPCSVAGLRQYPIL